MSAYLSIRLPRDKCAYHIRRIPRKRRILSQSLLKIHLKNVTGWQRWFLWQLQIDSQRSSVHYHHKQHRFFHGHILQTCTHGLPPSQDVRDSNPFSHAKESLLSVTLNCFFKLSFYGILWDFYICIYFLFYLPFHAKITRPATSPKVSSVNKEQKETHYQYLLLLPVTRGIIIILQTTFWLTASRSTEI